MYRKVDPAALLIAIFAVAFSPLTTVGPWDPMNTVIAVVVGAVLAAFTWPRESNLKDESDRITSVDPWITFAQATAYGLVIAIGIAWIVQLVWFCFMSPHPGCPVVYSADHIPPICVKAIKFAGYVTYVALVIGVVAARILFILMRKKIAKLTAAPPPPPPFYP